MSDQQSKRLLSLDVFRGITIAGMVLVNDAGDWGHVYEPLEHAPWNGLTPTDLIFPFFMFIVGVSMMLSFAKRRESGIPDRTLFRHVIVRSVVIFALGVFLYAFPSFDIGTMRIMGVLQRIAVAYFLASSIYFAFDRRSIQRWIAGILIGYWAAMKFIPVPGAGAGVWTPEGNLSGYIDRIFLSGHMWYLTKTWDPEGLLSTVPSIATVLLGVLAGFELRSPRPLHEKINAFFSWGVAAVIGALIVNPFFPINKNLWTSSYVLVTGGLALIGLACCMYVVEVKERKTWAKPFVILGVNAIAAYTFAGLLSTTISTIHIGSRSLQEVIYSDLFGWISDPFVKSVSFAAAFVVVTWVFAWFLYKKKWFLKV